MLSFLYSLLYKKAFMCYYQNPVRAPYFNNIQSSRGFAQSKMLISELPQGEARGPAEEMSILRFIRLQTPNSMIY